MNKIDNILDRLQNEQPILDCPNELTERIMTSLPERRAFISKKRTVFHPIKFYWRWIAAACLIALIGAGVSLVLKNNDDIIQPVTRHKDISKITDDNTDDTIKHPSLHQADLTVEINDTLSNVNENETNRYLADLNRAHKHHTRISNSIHKETVQIPKVENCIDTATVENNKVAVREQKPPIYDNNIHYASLQPADTTRQAPSKVNDFIAKFAEYNAVKPVALNCEDDNTETQTVSNAYIFPDRDGVDLFSRLLQVAVCYDQKHPGYQLNLSNNQFVFQLQDNNKNLKYLWMAERINGQRILLFATQSPINVSLSTACYQEFRDELTHTGNAYQQL